MGSFCLAFERLKIMNNNVKCHLSSFKKKNRKIEKKPSNENEYYDTIDDTLRGIF